MPRYPKYDPKTSSFPDIGIEGKKLPKAIWDEVKGITKMGTSVSKNVLGKMVKNFKENILGLKGKGKRYPTTVSYKGKKTKLNF